MYLKSYKNFYSPADEIETNITELSWIELQTFVEVSKYAYFAVYTCAR